MENVTIISHLTPREWKMSWENKVVEDTRGRLNKLFHGPGPESVVFTSGVGAALDAVIRGLFKDGDHVLISSMESDVVMDALNDIGHEAGQEGPGGGVYADSVQ